jgi:hypothetical protein
MEKLNVSDRIMHVRKLLNDWDKGKRDQPNYAHVKAILLKTDSVKVKDIRIEKVSFSIDFSTYEQIQQLLLTGEIQKQDDYDQMLAPPPVFMRVRFNEEPFSEIIRSKCIKDQTHRRLRLFNESDPYNGYNDVLSDFSSQGPSRLGVFSDVDVHSYDFELKVGLMLINTALHNVKQVAKRQDDLIEAEEQFPETLIGSYDTTNIALANCLIIRDHIISSLRFHKYMHGHGANDDDVPAPHIPNVCERQFFKDVSDGYLKLKVVVEHEMQPRPDTQGKLVYQGQGSLTDIIPIIIPISKYDQSVRPIPMQGGKSKRVKRVNRSKRVKRSKRVNRSKRSKTRS